MQEFQKGQRCGDLALMLKDEVDYRELHLPSSAVATDRALQLPCPYALYDHL